MMVLFAGEVTQIIVGYITQYLQVHDVGLHVFIVVKSYVYCELLKRYEQNPVGNWKDKDTAVYLLTSIAAQGEVTKVTRKSCILYAARINALTACPYYRVPAGSNIGQSTR
jgi:hypothetical protein